jgi:8-oxo-dGTP pyrophosphatase MutT (NUDIX family)
MAIISLALLIVDDKILMFRREIKKNDKFSGKFGLPGGHVKEQENTLDGAKRETMEETGLKLNNPLYVNSYKFDDNKIYLYAEELKDANGIKLNHEHTEYKLFDPEDLETDGSIIPTTKFMYNDYLNKRGIKPKQKELQTNEDLEYIHVDNAVY